MKKICVFFQLKLRKENKNFIIYGFKWDPKRERLNTKWRINPNRKKIYWSWWADNKRNTPDIIIH